MALPVGEERAHQMTNTSDGVLRHLCFSTMTEPEVGFYPDSGKYVVFAGSAPGGPKEKRTLSKFLRGDAEAGYWEGEGTKRMAEQTAQIRDYRAGDAPEIARLFYETVRSVNRADYSEEQVRAWAPGVPDVEEWHARMADRRTLVVEEGGEVAGFAELEGDGHLDTLYLRKDVVGRGIGRRLYEAIEREARCQGLRRIFTEASITARPFFKRRGFRVVRERTVTVRGVSMTNFEMEKDLLPG